MPHLLRLFLGRIAALAEGALFHALVGVFLQVVHQVVILLFDLGHSVRVRIPGMGPVLGSQLVD